MLANRVDTLATELPENERASYFELIQYPVDACANLTEMYISAGRNALDARLGNPKANDEAAAVQQMFAKDAALSDEYNHKLMDGKWDHMMDQTHIGYVLWNDPPVNVMPAVSWIQVPETGSLGVIAEDATFSRAGGRFGFSLGTIDSIYQQTRTLTLFDRGKTPVSYEVKTSAPWLTVSKTQGMIGGDEQTIVLDADWSRVTGDEAEGTVTVSSGDARPMVYTLHARKLPVTREDAQGFVEGDGYVAMDAADTTSRTAHGAGDGAMRWVELPGYGATKSGMTVYPVTAPSEMDSKTSLQYRMYLYDSGAFELQMTLAPTLNFVPGRGLRFAVSVDDGPRTMVDALEHNSDKDWAQAVSDGVRRVTVPLTIAAPGYHTLKVWAVDPALVVERVVVSHGANGSLKPSYLGPPESFHAGVVGAENVAEGNSFR